VNDATKEFYASAVSAALLNKYSDNAIDSITEKVTAILADVKDHNERKLVSRLRPVRCFLDDVNNQTITLALIERHWASPPKLNRPLTTLNTCSLGRITPVFRSKNFVEDFGRKVPTPKNEVRTRLDELERLCQYMVRYMCNSHLKDKALVLAYIVGALIRVHPFRDGNGRTARLFVFYSLRCWGLPLFPIPKVRNDQRWKNAMDAAVAGDPLWLKNEILWRMKLALGTYRPQKDK